MTFQVLEALVRDRTIDFVRDNARSSYRARVLDWLESRDLSAQNFWNKTHIYIKPQYRRFWDGYVENVANMVRYNYLRNALQRAVNYRLNRRRDRRNRFMYRREE